MKEYIAYKEIDSEGDHWAERAFLFESREDVRTFFHPDNPDLKKLYCDEGLTGGIMDFEISDDNPSKHITQIKFFTGYAGETIIVEMHDGYLIPSNSKPTT